MGESRTAEERIQRELALLEAALAQERSARAVRALVDYLMPCIQSTALRVLHVGAKRQLSDAVRDVRQEVLLKMFREDEALLRRWEPGRGDLLAYTATITRTTAIDWLRRNMREESGVSEDQAAAEHDASVPALDEQILEKDFAQRVWQKVSRDITPADCLLIEKLVVRDQAPKEVAKDLGLTLNNLFVKRHRLLRLAKRIAEELGGRS